MAEHVSPPDMRQEPAAQDTADGADPAGPHPRVRVPRSFWAVLALYGVMAFVMFDQMEEDAFIYFRTAANISRGAGYVFNAGGEHIETGSSLTWQYLLALAHFLSLDLVLFAKLLGIGLGGCTLYLVLRISDEIMETRGLRVLPALLLAVTIPFYWWAQRGLETSLYTFSIVSLGFVLTQDRWSRYWYLPTLLVAFSRSEGFIVLLGLVGFAYFERQRARRHLPGLAVVLALLVGSEILRFFYFHDVVPHAFYLKILSFPGLGGASVRQFLWETRLGILGLIAGLGLLGRSRWTRSLVVLACLDLPFLWWAYRTGAGTNNNRHLAPALPLLCVLIVRGLDSLVARRPYLIHPLGFGLGLYVPWLAFRAPALDLSLTPRENPFTDTLLHVAADPARHVAHVAGVFAHRPRRALTETDYTTEQITANSQYLVGDFIARTYPPGITVVYDQMGQTAWYGGLDKRFIDTFGLTYKSTAFALFDDQVGESESRIYGYCRQASEALIARAEPQPARHWTTHQVVDHLFSLRPELFIFVSLQVGRHLPDGTYEYFPGILSELVRDPRMEKGYVRRLKWWLFFYERKDQQTHWDESESRIPGKADTVAP